MDTEKKQISSLLARIKDAIDKHYGDANKMRKTASALATVSAAICADKSHASSLLRIANQALVDGV